MTRKPIFQTILILLFFLTSPGFLCAEEKSVSISLAEAVRMALENNLNLKIQENELTAAFGGTQAQQAAFDTMVGAGAFTENSQLNPETSGGIDQEDIQGWNAGVQKKLETGTTLDMTWQNQRYDADSSQSPMDPAYQSELSVGMSQPLLKGRDRSIQTADLAAAEKNMLAVSSQVESKAVDLCADVRKAYWDLHFLGYDIEVKQLSLELARQIVEDTRHKIQAGVLASVEIYRPESELARREENLINAERMRSDAEDALKLLLNKVDWDVFLKTEALPDMPQELPKVEDIVDHILRRHPNLKATDLLIQAAQLNMNKAEDSLQPEVSLAGRAGVNGVDEQYGDAASNLASDPDFSWKIGLNFSMPLSNDLARGNAAVSRARLSQSKLNHELLKQQLILQSKALVRNFSLALKSIDAAEKTVLAAKKTLETEQEKFNAGVSTSLDILLAQESYTQALAGQKRAHVNHAVLLAELDRIKGVLPGSSN